MGLIWASIVAGLGALVFITAIVVFLVAASETDFYDGDYYYVDDSSVLEAVQEPCDDMVAAGEQIVVFSGPDEGARQLHQFVDAARLIIIAIDATGTTDKDSLDWRDDWRVLLDAVERYADALAGDPDAEYEEPTTSRGDSIIYQMSYGSEIYCEVPAVIAALDSTPPPAY